MVDVVVPPVVVPPVVVPKPWYDGKADAEMVGHWANKSWDAKDPAVIAIEATKAHREAEKLIGAPASQLLRLPADMEKDTNGMKAVWQRLGAVEAKDYDFPALKDKDGKVANQALDTLLRDTAARINLPKSMAAEVAAAVAKHETDVATASAADKTVKLAAEKVTLSKNWGANEPMNRVIAANAAKALGATQAEIDALESVIGYARTMEMFLSVGTKIGEDKFVRQPGPGGTGILSKGQAEATLKDLKADKAWVERYNNGGSAEKKQMGDLLAIIVGDESQDRI